MLLCFAARHHGRAGLLACSHVPVFSGAGSLGLAAPWARTWAPLKITWSLVQVSQRTSQPTHLSQAYVHKPGTLAGVAGTRGWSSSQTTTITPSMHGTSPPRTPTAACRPSASIQRYGPASRRAPYWQFESPSIVGCLEHAAGDDEDDDQRPQQQPGLFQPCQLLCSACNGPSSRCGCKAPVPSACSDLPFVGPSGEALVQSRFPIMQALSAHQVCSQPSDVSAALLTPACIKGIQGSAKWLGDQGKPTWNGMCKPHGASMSQFEKQEVLGRLASVLAEQRECVCGGRGSAAGAVCTRACVMQHVTTTSSMVGSSSGSTAVGCSMQPTEAAARALSSACMPYNPALARQQRGMLVSKPIRKHAHMSRARKAARAKHALPGFKASRASLGVIEEDEEQQGWEGQGREQLLAAPAATAACNSHCIDGSQDDTTSTPGGSSSMTIDTGSTSSQGSATPRSSSNTSRGKSSSKAGWQTQHGYLKIMVGLHPETRKAVYESAHRLVLQAMVGPPPPGLNEAIHLCGNKMCLCPAHLVWGTHKANMSGNVEPALQQRTAWLTSGQAPLELELAAVAPNKNSSSSAPAPTSSTATPAPAPAACDTPSTPATTVARPSRATAAKRRRLEVEMGP